VRNAYWVEPGRLLAGDHPRAENADALVAAGVTAFVDLTQPDEIDPYVDLFDGAVHHRMPVGNFGVPSDDEMTATLDLLDDLLADGHVVYVHCWAGVGRTGTVVACHLVRHGMSGRAALARLAELREAIGRHDLSPEMPEQRALVERWRP
jgi:protein-tyrosine phosphatase